MGTVKFVHNGVEREIEFDLHDPTGPDLPWFAMVGTEVPMTPQQMARAAAPGQSGGFLEVVESLAVETQTKLHNEISIREAKAYDHARRRSTNGRTGRPRQVWKFTNAEDFAIVALYFESIGHKQAVKATLKYWMPATYPEPTRRRIDEAIKKVRTWHIPDLHAAADATRKIYGLGPLPLKVLRKGRSRAE